MESPKINCWAITPFQLPLTFDSLKPTKKLLFNKVLYLFLNFLATLDSFSKVISNGPAAGSDLKEGDLICSVNGKNLNTINDLREFVYGKVPGVEVELEVIRGESRKNIKIALGRKN